MNTKDVLKQIRADVIARDNRTCYYCGKTKLYTTQLNLDHIHPESQGGLFTASNLVVACKQCNHRKGKKSVADYVASRLVTLAREIETLRQLQGIT